MHESSSNFYCPVSLNPLVQAIEQKKSIVYVGAGVSMSAGLPDWKGFLEECINREESVDSKPSRWKNSRILLENGEYLKCAELIVHQIGPRLGTYVWEIFGDVRLKPSPIHYSISRIPFSIAVTTNYDRLLESAYPGNHGILTWKEAKSFFKSLKEDRFSIFKIHGDVGNDDSLIATRSHFSDLINENPAFIRSMSTAFSLKTCLFVGSSLKDQDLLFLLDATKRIYGDNVGPHYAIMFDDEIDELFIKHLSDSYNINVIACRKPSINHGDWRTEAVCSFLKYLSGKVANSRLENIKSSYLESSIFNIKDVTNRIISNLVEETGSHRGSIALVPDSKLNCLNVVASHERYSRREDESTEIFDNRMEDIENPNQLIDPNSTLGFLFLQGNDQVNYIYAKNINSIPYESNFEASIPEYIPQNTGTRSFLACQIHLNGRKVGVIIIESDEHDIYTKDHLEAIFACADSVARAYDEYKHRMLSASGIMPFLRTSKVFCRLMDISRQLSEMKMRYILYEVDYYSGKVIAHYDADAIQSEREERNFEYLFSQRCLVTHVLKTCKEEFIEDVEIELDNKNTVVAKEGVDYFKIKRSLYGLPLYVNGHISSVLIAWSATAHTGVKKLRTRISRLAHLIANDPDRTRKMAIESRRSFQFIQNLDKELERLDNRSNWGIEDLMNEMFRINMLEAMLRILVHPSCGIARVRLWRYMDTSEGEFFKCIKSLTVPEATAANKPEIDAYREIKLKISHPHIKHTIAHALGDPTAIVQHESMFVESDWSYELLDKDSQGKWIVGPIVHNTRVLGFIACDNHYPPPHSKYPEIPTPLERQITEDEEVFQRYAVDLIADAVVNLMRLN